jgi:outer membrane protein
MKTKLYASIFFVLSYFVTFSQPSGQNVWTLKQCIDYALSKNISVQRSMLNTESSQVDLDVALLSRIPTVNGNASYGYSWGRGLDPVSNSFVSQQIKSSNLSANGSLPVFNAFRLDNVIKQNQNSSKAARQDLEKAKNDVILSVSNLFINVVFNKELVENAKFQLTSSQRQLERIKKQVEAGALPRSEELNLDAQVATNEVTLVQQENALALSLLQLKQALLIPASQEFDVVVLEISPEDLILDQSRDQIYDIARQSMPEIKSAALKIESAKFSVRAARSNLYPRLSLNGGVNTNYSSTQEQKFVADGTQVFSNVPIGYLNQDINSPVFRQQFNGSFQHVGYTDQLRQNIYRTLGFQLTIPVFNNYNARATVRRSLIQRENARINAIEIDQTLRQNVETAYNNALASSKTYNASTRQVQAREEAFRMMEQRMSAGAANSFEYQVSQNDLFRAKTDLTRAKYDFIFRKKVLDFYQGKPLQY